MKKPLFITFTGADDRTSIDGMLELASLYPIEWGLLFSPKRQGVENRYPTLEKISEFATLVPSLSAHLCGGYASELIDTGHVVELDRLIGLPAFERAQINTADPHVNPAAIADWAGPLNVAPILQCRGDSFPPPINVAWLFDASGGRGIAPKAWPADVDSRGLLRGYAGGLNPDNVAMAVAVIGSKAPAYWIDMETGVRDENDRFDLARCRAVCEAVYGKPA